VKSSPTTEASSTTRLRNWAGDWFAGIQSSGAGGLADFSALTKISINKVRWQAEALIDIY
jgi:hypothetical protein